MAGIFFNAHHFTLDCETVGLFCEGTFGSNDTETFLSNRGLAPSHRRGRKEFGITLSRAQQVKLNVTTATTTCNQSHRFSMFSTISLSSSHTRRHTRNHLSRSAHFQNIPVPKSPGLCRAHFLVRLCVQRIAMDSLVSGGRTSLLDVSSEFHRSQRTDVSLP